MTAVVDAMPPRLSPSMHLTWSETPAQGVDHQPNEGRDRALVIGQAATAGRGVVFVEFDTLEAQAEHQLQPFVEHGDRVGEGQAAECRGRDPWHAPWRGDCLLRPQDRLEDVGAIGRAVMISRSCRS
ncbi:hypothetical protein JMJ56_16155 [Belnapia sp. T18]|uniref:Uncharacterized protein n=1 Tax=Belnapia arida TaxID=2804533 RepID=A0ABS1U4E7_9PROT|nr:hypothetical protein [Belnapia arida]MBL6079551.1 hypothetical protein [Belnapia arida]